MPDKAKKAPKNAKNKPKKAVIIPNPPEYFSGYSLKKWEELAPIFAEKNMLGPADLSAFELLCLHYGDAMDLYKAMINEGGSIASYLAGKNSQTMGEYLAYHKAITAYHKMLTEFGLTPASKKKVPTPEVIEEDDPLEKMING
ncbi:P27 family phage terminase small subunit [Brachyspira hyodysenteriae]|uniref:P27 family phage terminase small subunit n=1 Tax=Brachyspira hyodysenteriae TaxID=159 RepID=UPI00063D9ED7|nr:P27 family phage terminase small subunit [Brachyspira hyodysenteriae]KLI22337.1 terminase [Brachyspira hyodysenteriae]TVL62707.1 terminase [Brachyspira hyodysenteriae]TVL80392.1 terminase [Brachyspira hyodysenteriae]TVL83515.1 terminase [Brachyspira hyodysenteriae]